MNAFDLSDRPMQRLVARGDAVYMNAFDPKEPRL